MTSSCRLLTQVDYAVYDAFLVPYTITSMFLRGNAARAGMVNKGQKYQADYYGHFVDGQLTGVIALNYNGNVFVQAPNLQQLDKLHDYARSQKPDFMVMGLLGPDDQCQHMLQRLAIPDDLFKVSEVERGYNLHLDRIIVPPLLSDGTWLSRHAAVSDAPTLGAWDIEYDREALGEPPEDSDPLDVSIADEIERMKGGNVFVLQVDGQIVARSHFNSIVGDTVQIGAVYTPPPLRGKNYARAAVAGSLLTARAEGKAAAVLFCKDPAAMRAYEGIGFEYVTDYHLTLLKAPGHPL